MTNKKTLQIRIARPFQFGNILPWPFANKYVTHAARNRPRFGLRSEGVSRSLPAFGTRRYAAPVSLRRGRHYWPRFRSIGPGESVFGAHGALVDDHIWREVIPNRRLKMVYSVDQRLRFTRDLKIDNYKRAAHAGTLAMSRATILMYIIPIFWLSSEDWREHAAPVSGPRLMRSPPASAPCGRSIPSLHSISAGDHRPLDALRSARKTLARCRLR